MCDWGEEEVMHLRAGAGQSTTPQPHEHDMLAKILLLMCLLALPLAAAEKGDMLYQIPLKDIDNQPTTLAKYRGKVLLIVNVASKCGNTPQYSSLESIYQKNSAKGLVVLGFPCNDFGSQEPGTLEEIKQFCSKNYSVTFPMFDKLHVKGPEQHPLYACLTGKDSPFPGDIKWNFGKFLISRNGQILARFEPGIKPDAPEVVQAIDKALSAQAN
jgi:glutathione peroxidase